MGTKEQSLRTLFQPRSAECGQQESGCGGEINGIGGSAEAMASLHEPPPFVSLVVLRSKVSPMMALAVPGLDMPQASTGQCTLTA